MKHSYKNYQLNKLLDLLNKKMMLGEGKLSIGELCETSLTSQRTTERLFSNHLKLPFTKYFAALRLEHAAHLLTNTRLSVREIAEKVGYEEHSAFTREFRKRLNMSPSQFRANKSNHFQLSTNRNYSIIDKTASLFIYRSHVGQYDIGIDLQFEQNMWDNLVEYAQQQQIICEPIAYYGIGFDDSEMRGIDNCRFYACIAVTKEPKRNSEVNTLIIPAGKYARFEHRGGYDELEAVYEEIFYQLLCDNQINLRDEHVLEHYVNSPTELSSGQELITELYFPIE